MVAGHAAAGKFPLTGQLSVTRRQRPDRLHLGGGRSGVDNHRGEPASLLLKLLNRARISVLEMRSTDQDKTGRNGSAFEDLLLLLTPAFLLPPSTFLFPLPT